MDIETDAERRVAEQNARNADRLENHYKGATPESREALKRRADFLLSLALDRLTSGR